MTKLPRFGSAISAVAIAAMLTGCAAPLGRTSSASRLGSADFALASRAQAALSKGDVETAISLAERAVELNSGEANVRTLLGNAYFAGGRFASAEAAYRDSLSLAPNQTGLMLKLALVQIAQGKHAEALAFLADVRPALEAADYGLAVALAGRPDEAIAVLESAARVPGAESRVRQNLALAQGLAGNWEAARVIAAQDLSPSLVDQRVQQWMAFAKPVGAADQVAALVGVTPAAADPGQPVRLALRQGEQVQTAQVQVPAPVSVPAQTYAMAQPAVSAADQPRQAMSDVPPLPMPEVQAEVAFAPTLADPVDVVPAIANYQPKAPESKPVPAAAAKLAEVRKASAPKPVSTQRNNSDAGIVVQIGAYSSPARVEKAWEQVSGRYSALREYTPTSARFDSDSGTVYRLAVKGFASNGEASNFCANLKRKGKSCFVRRVAGDSPVRFASR